jgi:hypothetical protein
LPLTVRESVDYFHYAFSVSVSSSDSKLNETGDRFEWFAIALQCPATFVFVFVIYVFNKMCLFVFAVGRVLSSTRFKRLS